MSTTTKLRPSNRRSAALATVLAALAVFVLAGCLTTGQASVRDAMNADRHAHSRTTLAVQSQAQAKAQAWANHLAAQGSLSHSVLTDGITVHYCQLGENVGMGPTVSAIETAYMNSTTHRTNILDTRWNGVGVGYAKHGNVVYTVQFFIKTC